MPSQVMRIVQLKPSNDMNPNLRCKNSVSPNHQWFESGPESHLQDWLLTKAHEVGFITVNGSPLGVMDLFWHFRDTRTVRQLIVVFHVVVSGVLAGGFAKGAVNLVKIPSNMRRL